jgi:hypothetical protein
MRFRACSDSCEYLSSISSISSCTLTLPNLPANCVRSPSWPRFLLQDRGRPIFGDVTFGLVCSWLSSNRLSMSIPFAPERNLSLFAVHFAFVFENDDEGESVSFCMSCPERIPCSGCVPCCGAVSCCDCVSCSGCVSCSRCVSFCGCMSYSGCVSYSESVSCSDSESCQECVRCSWSVSHSGCVPCSESGSCSACACGLK